MENDKEALYDIAIVGSGAAGSMAVLRAVLNNLKTVCFKGAARSKKKARATWVKEVENMPLMHGKVLPIANSSEEVFRWIESNEDFKDNLKTISDSVKKISGKKEDFSLLTDGGDEIRAKYVLLCTGIMDIQPKIDGEILPVLPFANQGCIAYCIRCDGHKSKGKDTSVIGHKDEAAHVAIILKERYNNPSISILTNGEEPEFLKNERLQELIKKYEINVYESFIKEISPAENGAGMKGFALDDGTFVNSQIAFVSLGEMVYNELAVSLGCDVDEEGYVLCDDFGETNVPGVFVAGDLRAGKKKQIYTAWDTAVDSVDKIDSYVRRGEYRQK